jgi:pimeloyl-ACP methyl ester carboxylesterase
MFQTGALSADANALHEVLGGDGDAIVVGHDWGALTSYGAAAAEPDRWRRVVGMAVPPGSAVGAAFIGNPDQLKRSWYMFFFQHRLADIVVPADDLALIDRLWADWSPGLDAIDDVERAKRCLRDPVNLTAALGYYRAALGDAPRRADYDAIQAAGGGRLPQPTLYLHGRDDGCIGVEVAEMTRTMCPWATVEVIDEAGHFLQLERPDVVNAAVVAFVTG